MKYYRDIETGETLQAGDERMNRSGAEWVPVEAVWIGQPAPEDLRACFRRPVDLPVLQPVTPEAMAELEGEEIRTIAALSQRSVKAMMWGGRRLRQWVSRAGQDNPLEWQWFIDLSTIPEVT